MKSVEELQALSLHIDELFDSGRETEGQKLLADALVAARRNEAYLRFFEGEQAVYNGDLETARHKEEEAVALAPQDSFLLKNYGVVLSHLGRLEEAIALYNQALAIKPNDYHSLRNKGVSLAELGRIEEAITFFDQALAIKPDDYHSLRNKGAALSELGRMEEAIALFDQALTIKPCDCHSLRNKGASLSKLGREEEAIALYDQALAIKPDEYHSLHNKGVSLSKLGREEEALTLFGQVLAIKPDEYHSLRDRGVSLSKLGREEEAIALFDQALTIKPDDYHSLHNKGASLSKLGREEEAIALYDQALAIKPDYYHSLRQKGVSLFRLGRTPEAYKAICAALALKSDEKRLQNEASFVYSRLTDTEKASVAEEETTFPKPDAKNLGGLKGFIQTVRSAFESEIADFEKKKAANEKHLREFIMEPSRLDPEQSIFLVLRKWNSYTPALPLDSGEKSLGGGYFLFHRGVGTVIDPGYNFIENFHRAGCRLQDINNIIITHAHNDHTFDFESLLTLLYQAHKQKSQGAKKVNLFLNQGALLKFGSLLDWRARKSLNLITVIPAGSTHNLDEMGSMLTVLPAYHDEIVTRYYAVGLHFSFDFGADGKRNLLFTSDTGLYPAKETEQETDDERNRRRVEIHERYKSLNPELVSDIDLLIPHLGSIGEKELKPIEELGLDKDSWQEEDILYGNHLGVLGVLRMISEIKPKVALVSEFGEELKGFRSKLLELMQRVVNGVIEEEGKPRLLPADLPFIYAIKDKTAYCAATGQMEPADKMFFEEEEETFYYFCAPKKRIGFRSLKNQYENSIKPYLKLGE